MNFGLVIFPCFLNDDRNGEVTRELQGNRKFMMKLDIPHNRHHMSISIFSMQHGERCSRRKRSPRTRLSEVLPDQTENVCHSDLKLKNILGQVSKQSPK